jgi:hypothetical protein
MEREPEQALLAAAADGARDVEERLCDELPVANDPDEPALLDDEDPPAAVVRRDRSEGRVEATDDGFERHRQAGRVEWARRRGGRWGLTTERRGGRRARRGR